MKFILSTINKMRYWWFEREHEVPHPEEIRDLYFNYITKHCTTRIRHVSVRYFMGFSMEEIAQEMGCTRERVRQLLFKARRVAHVERNLRKTS